MVYPRSSALLLTFVLSSGLLGCVSIESNVAKDYDATLSKVFVSVQGGSGFERFAQNIGKYLQQAFVERGIEVELYTPDPLSLDTREEIEARISEFAPDGILVIQQTEGSFINGARSGAKLDAVLAIPGREGAVWRANISSGSGGYAGAGSPTKVANRIVSQMEKDGLFAKGS